MLDTHHTRTTVRHIFLCVYILFVHVFVILYSRRITLHVTISNIFFSFSQANQLCTLWFSFVFCTQKWRSPFSSNVDTQTIDDITLAPYYLHNFANNNIIFLLLPLPYILIYSVCCSGCYCNHHYNAGQLCLAVLRTNRHIHTHIKCNTCLILFFTTPKDNI